MESAQSALRMEPHKASFSPAFINGKKSGELFITLRTRKCSWGKCLFCGLKGIDGDKPPLMREEAAAQVRNTIMGFERSGGRLEEVGKVSLITNSDSILNPRTVNPDALAGMLMNIREGLPAVSEIEFESRAEYILTGRLLALSHCIDDIMRDSRVARTISLGIESPYGEVREAIRKGLSDEMLLGAAARAASAGFGIRGYFIYNLIEPQSVSRIDNLLHAVDLMTWLSYNVPQLPKVSILIIRGYVPEETADTPLFRKFREVPDGLALSELQKAAAYSKRRGIRFEIDSTTEDQQNTGSLTTINRDYLSALIRYNTTLDPRELIS